MQARYYLKIMLLWELLEKKGPAIFSMIIDFLELLKRRGQEYFTLVLTKNYSNLVAALSYCSDEGN